MNNFEYTSTGTTANAFILCFSCLYRIYFCQFLFDEVEFVKVFQFVSSLNVQERWMTTRRFDEVDVTGKQNDEKLFTKLYLTRKTASNVIQGKI